MPPEHPFVDFGLIWGPMWELFEVIFVTLGFSFELHQRSWLPKGAPKAFSYFWSILGRIWGPVSMPRGLLFLVDFSIHFREPSRSDLRASSDGFGSDFSSMLAPFWESFWEWKSVN